MEQTTRIELTNQDDLVLVRAGVMNPEDVRRLTVEDALVDTSATGLCLPAPLSKQLGLTPLRKVQAQTANGIVERVIYSEVEYTVLQRSDSIRVTDLPQDMPVLLGHMILEALDLCVDMKKGLIHNPAHDGSMDDKDSLTTKGTST